MARRSLAAAAGALAALLAPAPALAARHHRPSPAIRADVRALHGWAASMRPAMQPAGERLKAAYKDWEAGPGQCVKAVETAADALPDGRGFGVSLTTGFLETQIALQLSDPVVAALQEPVGRLRALPLRTPAGRAVVRYVVRAAGQAGVVAAEEPADLCPALAEYQAAGFPDDPTPQLDALLTAMGRDLGVLLDPKLARSALRPLERAGLTKHQAEALLDEMFPHVDISTDG